MSDDEADMTEEQKEFLKALEEEFKDRYTEKDESYRETLKENFSEPPIMENWVRERSNRPYISHSGQRYNYDREGERSYHYSRDNRYCERNRFYRSRDNGPYSYEDRRHYHYEGRVANEDSRYRRPYNYEDRGSNEESRDSRPYSYESRAATEDSRYRRHYSYEDRGGPEESRDNRPNCLDRSSYYQSTSSSSGRSYRNEGSAATEGSAKD